MAQATLREIPALIAARKPFKGNSLFGISERPGSVLTGRLNDTERQAFISDAHHIDYVVISYGTPIAWHRAEGWYVVGQKFSVTTSKHQGKVRQGIAS